ncbi:hypothetical protein AVEN_131627-1 [Araneus ventricosus]|uniref:Endonuclease/exonuclease/phosphatase domain-containing protein n=1 Tax=Araneus ventricosus TaxID=182803 RepID=A0A4Y2EVB3_ARAVE|nr:hypothetical protein AVEN_131627-1 [Araneus ventricosus]
MKANKQIEIKTTYAKMLENNAPKPVTNISFKGAVSKKVPPLGPSKLTSERTTTNLAQAKIVNIARSKSTLPTLIIKPANEEIKSSGMLKTALEGKIKLKDIQVEVLSCRPLQGNGIVVKTKTPEMLEKLKTTIMNDLTLRDKCQVYIPKPRIPHIIIFDIPPQDGDKAAHENNFILQLKESNELTDQEIKAAPLVSFILKYDLIIWNDKDSEPTFETVNGKSWIDITMSSANMANKKMNWQVIKNNFSDHNYLVFNVESSNATWDPPRIFFNHKQILKICKAVHQKFLELQEEIQTIDSKQKLEKWTEEFTNTINQIIQSFPRKVIKHLRVPWWDSELEVNRKKTLTLRSR